MHHHGTFAPFWGVLPVPLADAFYDSFATIAALPSIFRWFPPLSQK